MNEIIIIGGGASGMAATVAASENAENHITLIERQARLGRKLLSTGNGRCNLTNMLGGIERYHGEAPDFAGYALDSFTPQDSLDFFSSLGLMTVTEYGGRVFPMSNQAASVLDVFRYALEKPNVTIRCGESVEKITCQKRKFGVKVGGETLLADKVIVACGGCAGSKLGGVMDGYRLLEAFGHSRTALHPALTQIRTQPDYPRALKGVRAEAAVSVMRGGKALAKNCGEVLFTDSGVSGTAAFEISRTASAGGEGLEIGLDFFDGLGHDELEKALESRREKWADKPANQILTGTVHNRLGQMICKYAGVGGAVSAQGLSRSDVESIACAAKSFRLKITGVSGFDCAQVTAGGVKTSEFDSKTMQSRIVPGLFACGEVLDIDGDCGGYNLRWAWASGMLAGRSCV